MFTDGEVCMKYLSTTRFSEQLSGREHRTPRELRRELQHPV
jgi:hypothetical protein